MATHTSKLGMSRLRSADFQGPALLLALSLVPILGGVARVKHLAGSKAVGADDERFFAAPTPVMIHVVAATVYALLGAFQFSTRIRLRWRNWHRRAGVLLLGCSRIAHPSPCSRLLAYAVAHD